MDSAPRALIAGLGLIGGSIGIALRARGWRISFVDPQVTLDDARRAGAADQRSESIDEAADLVILATPVDAAMEILRTQDAGRRTTSVCSVMGPLQAIADEKRLQFVAGHPLTGSQDRGLGAARGDLFRGCVWFADHRDELMARMTADCGARMEIVPAAEHDVAVALTSHLPQILSTALAAHLDQCGLDDRFAGSGLRTFLRLAGSHASVWMPVIEANRQAIAPHADAVAEIVRAILAGDSTAFERAQRVWSRLLSNGGDEAH